MTHTKAWKRRQTEQRLAAERDEMERSGLLSTGKEAPFFKMLGVGEDRPIARTRSGSPVLCWFAPAHLVRLNRYLKKSGVSSKIRTRVIRSYLEGKDPPASALDAIAGYTEELLQRNQS